MNRIFVPLAFVAFLASTHLAVAQDETPPTFEENPGICMLHSLSAPQLVPGTKEWEFRTRLREGTAGICANFDGAFTVVTWGCGTECEDGAMVDRTDGRVYWLPDVASYRYEYHAESSLLIINSFTKADFQDGEVPDYLWREFYKFSHGKWTFVFKDKGGSSSME